MSSASVVAVLPPAFDASIAAMSSNPPSRLAMSPDGSGSPSSAVTTPTRSTPPSGAITTTRSCSGVRPNDSGSSMPALRTATASSGDTGSAVDRLRGDARGTRPGGSARACPEGAPAAARPSGRRRSTKLAQVREVAELRLVHRALGADRQRLAHLRDHHADLARGHLHPGELLHAEHRPELEAQTRHEQRRPGSRLRRGTRWGCPRRACGTRTASTTSPTSAAPIEWNDLTRRTRRSPRRSRRRSRSSSMCCPPFAVPVLGQSVRVYSTTCWISAGESCLAERRHAAAAVGDERDLVVASGKSLRDLARRRVGDRHRRRRRLRGSVRSCREERGAR